MDVGVTVHPYSGYVSDFEFDDSPPWGARIGASGLPDRVEEVLRIIDEHEAGDTSEQDHVDRIRRVVEAVASIVSSADPFLIADSTINQLAQQLTQARDHLNQWVGGAGMPQLTAATGQADAAIASVAAIPLSPSATEAAAEIGSLRRSVGQHRGQVDREIEDLREASAKAQEGFTTKANDATARVTELEEEVVRLREELSQVLNAARDQANQQQNTFSSAQDQRQEAFSKLLEEKRTEATAAVEAIEADATEKADHHANVQKAHVDAAEAAKGRVEEILGIVSEEALVGAYSKNAAEEKEQADRWRWVAIALVLASVAIGVWIVSSAADDGTDWDQFAAKAVLALPIAAAATYAGKQSGEHRHVQREAEHMALQLAALGPYLNDLAGPEGRDELLTDIARKIFGQPRRDGATGPDADAPTTVSQMTSLIQEIGKLQR